MREKEKNDRLNHHLEYLDEGKQKNQEVEIKSLNTHDLEYIDERKHEIKHEE